MKKIPNYSIIPLWDDWNKIFLIMKFSVIIVLLSVLRVSANSYSQTVNIKLTKNTETIANIFKEIESQTDFKFFYRPDQIDLNKRVVVNTSNATIEQILDQLTRESKLKYLITEDHLIVIMPVNQKFTITGKVLSEDQTPLPGAAIRIKGSTTGTVTDQDGNFSLELLTGNETLEISYVGYISEEIILNGQSFIEVNLLPDLEQLEAVIVVGYGTSTERESTVAVSVVSGEKIQALNPSRVEQALQGQMSGVQISSASGSPGGNLNIRIRGLTTNGDNNPLVLVDDIPYSVDGLAALNPSDIESINVLKDASAGIYGVRAANGVILITTKKGAKNMKPSFTFDAYTGIQETAKKLDVLNATEYAVLKNEAAAAAGMEPLYADPYSFGEGTNWQNEVFQTAPISNYNLSLTGGSEKSSYSIGGSFLDQKGIVGGDKAHYTRYNARINFTSNITDNIKFQTVSLYSHEKRKTLPEAVIGSVLFNAINSSPLQSVTDTLGKYTYSEVSDVINPIALMENTFNEDFTNKLVGKFELSAEIIPGLDITGRVSYDYAHELFKRFNPYVYYGPGKPQNSADEFLNPLFTTTTSGEIIYQYNNVTEHQTQYLNYNFEGFINYSKELDLHNVQATLGTSYLGYNSKRVQATAYDVPYNSWEYATVYSANTTYRLNSTGGFENNNRLMSYFLRGEYGYDKKYLVSLILRRDASSRFGENNRFGYFPTGSAAWVISDESFFNVRAVDFLKLRASYGVSGNDKIGDFRYRGLLDGEGVYVINDQIVTGTALGIMSNPDLKWEQTKQTNIGLDLYTLQRKIQITAEYYIKKTEDLLSQPPVPGITGAYGAGSSAPWINSGDVKNNGFEFLITYKNTVSNDFNFSVSYNLTTYHNEVTKLPAGVDFMEFGAFGVGGGNTSRMEVGYPIGYFYGYKTDGVFQNETDIANHAEQTGAQPGDLRYVDLSGDGSIDFSSDEDKTIIGSPFPDVTMGLNLNAFFKGIDLSAMIYTSIGNDIIRNYERQTPMANLLSYRLNRWTGEGTSNDPRITNEGTTNTLLSDWWVEDGSYVRLKNLQFGYSLPNSVNEKLRINRARVYLSANNLITFTKYKGFDPDFSNPNPTVSGVDLGFYPQARTYMIGINLNF